MFDNVGVKIKGLAKALFIIETVLAVIAGFGVMLVASKLFVVGLWILLFGPIAAWISSLLIYGFGELIDKVCDIELHLSDRD